jgi:arylsulfatase A-like enzyme
MNAFHSKSSTRKPNLVFVFADQMRQSAMAHAPLADPVITPNLDRFARQGLSLTQCRSNFPVCSPYRAMLMSGRYPRANTVVSNINSSPDRPYDLRDDQICLTDVLAGQGYHVGYIGKWHLTRPVEPFLREADDKAEHVWNEWTPPHRRHGIAYWYGYNTYDMHMRPMYWDNDSPREGYAFVDQWSTEHETDKAIAYLQQHQQADSDQPFALFVSYNPPHPPFDQVPEKYRAYYQDKTPEQLLTRDNVSLKANDAATEQALTSVRNYFAAVTGVDEQFGRLMQALDQMQLSKNTLLVFTADHGEMMGSHQRMGKNTWQEESVLVPMIMRFPGHLKDGSQDDLLINSPDIPATLLGLLNEHIEIPQGWQGINYAPTLREPSSQSRPDCQFYFNTKGQVTGVHDLQYTAVIATTDGEVDQLYDRVNDPYQCHNLAMIDTQRMAAYRQMIQSQTIG